jgi:hypothetical protein
MTSSYLNVVRHLQRIAGQGLKPHFSLSQDVAAEAATHKSYLRDGMEASAQGKFKPEIQRKSAISVALRLLGRSF